MINLILNLYKNPDVKNFKSFKKYLRDFTLTVIYLQMHQNQVVLSSPMRAVLGDFPEYGIKTSICVSKRRFGESD